MVRWAASNWTAEGGGWPPALPLLELFAAAAAGSALGGRMTPPLSVVCTPSKMLTPYSMPRVGRWSVPSCRSGSDGSEAATDLRRLQPLSGPASFCRKGSEGFRKG